MGNAEFALWSETYRKEASTGTELTWPSETLVRLFKGAYVPGLDKDFRGKKVLDVGFGNGNNLAFLGTLGLKLSGVEVQPDICQAARQKLEAEGFNADLREGTNRSLPFPDDEFDFLVSWNVLHYDKCEADVVAALHEYARVLRPGGRLFLSTTGPEHKILEGATTLGDHRYQIGREDDGRKGQVFFYFDAVNYVQYYFSKAFSNILVGRTNDFLFTETLDWFIVTAIK